MGIGIFHPEFVVFLHVLFPADGPLVGILGSNLPIVREEFLNADILLLPAGTGNWQVCPNKHPGFKLFVLQFHRCPDTDPVSHGAALLHLPHAVVQQGNTAHSTFHTGQALLRPLGKARIGLHQGGEETGENTELAIHIAPADLPLGNDAVKFLFGKIGNMLADHRQRLIVSIGKLHRHPDHHFPLDLQAAAQAFRQIFILQADIDKPDGIFIVTVVLHTQNIFRQTHILVAKGMVDVHRNLPAAANRLPL